MNTINKETILNALSTHKASSYAAKAGSDGTFALPDGTFNVNKMNTNLALYAGKLSMLQLCMLASVSLYRMSNRDQETIKKYLDNGYVDSPQDIDKIVSATSASFIDYDSIIPDSVKVELTRDEILNMNLVSKLPKGQQDKIAIAEKELEDNQANYRIVQDTLNVNEINSLSVNDAGEIVANVSVHSDKWSTFWSRLTRSAFNPESDITIDPENSAIMQVTIKGTKDNEVSE